VPRRYPVAFRRKVLDLIEAGRSVAEIADRLGVSDQTIYNWRNQDQIDRGLRAGISSSESAELTAARKRIRELETELAVTKRANELLKAQSDPKGAGRSSRRS
jgi:transposase